MKKIGKIVFVSVVFIFMAVCQTNQKVYALSDSVKREINYQEGVPEEYDVEVDAGTMIESVKVPSITLSLEKALYGKDDLLDIDFFDTNSDNESDIWLKISNIVKKVYLGSLYIAAAVMLTLLIYIAVKVVSSSIFLEENMGEKDTGKRHRRFGNPFRGLKDKRFIETWISSVLCLILVIFVMNLIISFSDVLIDITSPDLKENEGTITVYLSGGAVSSSTVSGNSNINRFLFIGDSRTVQMASAVGNDVGVNGNGGKDIFIAKSGEKYEYMVNTAFPEVDNIITSGTKVIIWMGVNEVDKIGMIDSYAEAINKKAEEWNKKGAKVAFATVGPCVESYVKDNKEIDTFNKGVAEKLSDDVQVIDVYSYMVNTGYSLSDGKVHYTDETSKKVYNYMVDQASNGRYSSTVSKVVGACSFDTNIEGFYAFQTQHNWEDYAVQNILYGIAAVVATWTKFVLYALFIGRMLLIAFIIAIAPILIVIDAIRRISGNKSFLKKWIILFIYLVFIRTVINILYYVLTKTDVYTVADRPLYIFFIIVIIHIFAVISLYKMFRYLIRKEPKKT